MSSDTHKTRLISGFLLLVTIIITTLVAFTLVSESARNEKFWLCLITILLAETFTFILPILMRSRTQGRRILPLYFGIGTMIVFYDIGVLALCSVALLQVAFSILLSLHLIWFLCFMVSIGGAIVGKIYIRTQDAADCACRIPYTEMQDRLASLNNRLAMIPIANVAQAKQEFSRIFEDAQYLSRDNLPGGESVELEINQCLDNIGQDVIRIEKAMTSISSNAEASADATACANKIEKDIAFLRQLFEKRDMLLKRLRQAKG